MNPREYHDLSSHHEAFPPVPRRLETALVPRPYKLYRDLPPEPVPQELDALLKYSNGIVRRRAVNGVERVYRAASCTGGAYHVETYVVSSAGVWHYGAHDHALRPLRDGDYRRYLAGACALDQTPWMFLVLTSCYLRNAWRYGDRAYRHVFWDAGTVLANLEALAAARDAPLRAYVGFVDNAIGRLLGLDTQKELTVCVVALGPAVEAPSSPDLQPIDPLAVPAARVEIEYPRIAEAHAASALASTADVRQWRDAHAVAGMRPYAPPSYGNEPIESIIERRTSARRFRDAPLPGDALQAVLDAATAPLPFEAGPVTRYTVLTEREQNAHLALDQPLAGEAAANVYFTANLDGVFAAYGDRGYRLAQLEGGLRGGRAYLAATALGLRATGLTFYDDATRRVLGSDPMFLVALGA